MHHGASRRKMKKGTVRRALFFVSNMAFDLRAEIESPSTARFYADRFLFLSTD